MSAPADEVLYFYSIGIEEGKSFEEIRIEDYIHAYQTTGRPPPPVPTEPRDELRRKAMGLPKAFEPYVYKPVGAGAGAGVGLGGKEAKEGVIKDPGMLPLGQEFRERVVQGERYQSIGALAAYEHFSHEELRYYAYARGHKTAPVPVVMVPFVQASLPGAGAKQAVSAGGAAQEERLEHMCGRPEYAGHSPEEFRVAFLLYGREMTSAELNQMQHPSGPGAATAPGIAPPTQPLAPHLASPSTSAPTPTPTATLTPPTSSSMSMFPAPIFSAATAAGHTPAAATHTPQSTPRFTFGLR